MLRDADCSHHDLDWLIRHEQVAKLVMRRLSRRNPGIIAILSATAPDWEDARHPAELEQSQAALLTRYRLRMGQAASA